MFLSCHNIRIDWYKYQSGGLMPSEGTNSRFYGSVLSNTSSGGGGRSPLRGTTADLYFWVFITSELSGTNTSSGGLEPTEGPNIRFMVLELWEILPPALRASPQSYGGFCPQKCAIYHVSENDKLAIRVALVSLSSLCLCRLCRPAGPVRLMSIKGPLQRDRMFIK